MKYSFVILHYNVIAETNACIDSIKNRIHEPIDIVVVDNASPNGSGDILNSLYSQDERVYVIINKDNLGFANGNNVGISYARNVLKSDFVIVLNNDTYLVQDDFLDVIQAEWNYSNFAVMGPQIHTYSGINQNPVPWKLLTKKQVDKSIRNYFYSLIRTYLGINKVYNNLKANVKCFFRYKKTLLCEKEKNNNVRQENVKLHGSCFVFSPKFFEHFDGFDPRTFMYVEEDILYALVRKKNLLMVYNPKLEIFHAEKVATKSSSKNERKMKIFYYRENIRSLKILKKILEK